MRRAARVPWYRSTARPTYHRDVMFRKKVDEAGVQEIGGEEPPVLPPVDDQVRIFGAQRGQRLQRGPDGGVLRKRFDDPAVGPEGQHHHDGAHQQEEVGEERRVEPQAHHVVVVRPRDVVLAVELPPRRLLRPEDVDAQVVDVLVQPEHAEVAGAVAVRLDPQLAGVQKIVDLPRELGRHRAVPVLLRPEEQPGEFHERRVPQVRVAAHLLLPPVPPFRFLHLGMDGHLELLDERPPPRLLAEDVAVAPPGHAQLLLFECV
mmetsp:Transcript_30807/g.47644  ORF Transcript_30807/g.47644 Transcript_30807/m.47644 type:complete len:261 (+) Transcript_30807:261-1043(+)